MLKRPAIQVLVFLGVLMASLVSLSPCSSWAASDDATDASRHTAPSKTPSNEVQFKKKAAQESPSFQQKKWTGTQNASETNLEYDFVGPANSNLGNGHNG